VADGVGDPLEALVLPVEFGALALQFGDVPEHHEAPGRVFADETRLHRQPPRLPARDDPHRVAALRFERASDGPRNDRMERVAGREIDAEQSPRRGVVVRDTAATVDDHDAVV